MEKRSGSGRVWTEYHQFYLSSGHDDGWGGEATNGLIEPLAGGGAVIVTGASLGEINYRWATYDARPEEDWNGWDDVVEAPVIAGETGLHIAGWGR